MPPTPVGLLRCGLRSIYKPMTFVENQETKKCLVGQEQCFVYTEGCSEGLGAFRFFFIHSVCNFLFS